MVQKAGVEDSLSGFSERLPNPIGATDLSLMAAKNLHCAFFNTETANYFGDHVLMCPVGEAGDYPTVRYLRHHYFSAITKNFLLPTNVEVPVKAFEVIDAFAHVDDVPLWRHT
jgi:hypothetical protein